MEGKEEAAELELTPEQLIAAKEKLKAAAALQGGDMPAAKGQFESWVKVPADLKCPTSQAVIAVRFRADWTNTPTLGERQAILWGLSDGDERLAMNRAMGDPNRFARELSLQMVRSIDGLMPDPSGSPGPANIDMWWDQIGPKCRTQINRMWAKLNIMSKEETSDFFENCISVKGSA